MSCRWKMPCLVVLMLAPMVCVLGYETIGHRHLAEALAGGLTTIVDPHSRSILPA